MYAIFEINAIVSECTCVLFNIHPTYLFYTIQLSNIPHFSKHQSWELNFSFLNAWKLVLFKSFFFFFFFFWSLLLQIRKRFFHENANIFETGPDKLALQKKKYNRCHNMPFMNKPLAPAHKKKRRLWNWFLKIMSEANRIN